MSLYTPSWVPSETPVGNGDVRGMVVGRRRIITTMIKTSTTTVAVRIYYRYPYESHESSATPADGRRFSGTVSKTVCCFYSAAAAAASNPRVINCYFHTVSLFVFLLLLF